MSKNSDLISLLTEDNFELITRQSIEVDKLNNSSKLIIPNDLTNFSSSNKMELQENELVINVKTLDFNEDVKSFSVQLKKQKYDKIKAQELNSRWRVTAIKESFNVPGSRVVGVYIGLYDESYWRCSLQWQVGFGNFVPTQWDGTISEGKFENDGDGGLPIGWNPPSGYAGKPFYFFRWDEDGRNCDVNEVFLFSQELGVFVAPHFGVSWNLN